MPKGKISGRTITPLNLRRHYRVGRINGVDVNIGQIQPFSYGNTKKAYKFNLYMPERGTKNKRVKEPAMMADLQI